MDAPTTSADNGPSGGSGEGGWFTPRRRPEPPAGSERKTTEGRRLAAVRPMGRPAVGDEAAQKRISPAAEAAPVDAPTTDGGSSDAGRTDVGPTDGRPADADPTEVRRSGGVHLALVPVAPGHDHASPADAHPEPGPAHEPGRRDLAPVSPHGGSRQRPGHRNHGESLTAPPATAPRVPEQWSAPASAQDASPDAALIRRTMAEVGPIADKVTSYFYALLFVRHPDLRSLFPAAMDSQRDRLLKALLTAAEHIDNTDILVAYLENLGRGHRKYGTRPEHYPAVGECLIGALIRYASAVWDEETEAAWVRTYTTISQIMIDAAAADELRAPAWWYAEVVSHELRTPDVAVITVRPDQPYPFLAGQYTNLETPWWPRVWRHYSFASAPRSDGLLSFHVKAIPAGWVSRSLVHRARPGDIVRLGPPAGSMTVDHTTDSGLLCLGGGTGIAPIKALVEDIAEHGERRPVEVFYGARTDHDLYDIDTMLRLQQIHHWLAVRPIVDQQAHLQLPDAVRAYGPWNEYDAYLSGPPGMIRSGVHALRDIGIPPERIRHDSVEELVAAGR